MRFWRRLPGLLRVGVLALSCAALLGTGAKAEGGQSEQSLRIGKFCSRTGFSPSQGPIWTGSGTWNGSDLVLVDPVGRSLLSYSKSGQVKVRSAGPLSKSWSDLYPLRIAALRGSSGNPVGMVVQTEANRFFVLDSQYTFQGNVDALSRTAPDRSTIEKIYNWALAGRDVVAFADVRTPVGQGERWSTGVVRFPLDSEAKPAGFLFQADLGYPPDVPSRKFYRLGYSYIASLGETAYMVLMNEDGVHLYKSGRQGKLEKLDDGMGTLFSTKVPMLPAYVEKGDFVEVMREVERATMPAGLYGWKGALYLLSRRPQGGSTQWLLSRLDSQGQVIGTVEIPSRANHLFAVPGADEWAFVEKGPAMGLQEQEVDGMIRVPASTVEAAFFRAVKSRSSVLDLCR
jgi:hypothetical protein